MALQKNHSPAELKRRQEMYKPVEEFIKNVGVCNHEGQAHGVVKVTTYEEVHSGLGFDTRSGCSFRQNVRFFCKHCGILFDRSIEEGYKEPHPFDYS